MKYLFTLLTLIFIIPVQAYSQNPSQLRWLDFSELQEAMETEPRKILLFFHEETCTYCRKMEKTTFTNKEVMEELELTYYVVEMDVHTTDTIRMGGQAFINSEVGKKRFPLHELAKPFVKRSQHPVSFPVTVLLDENYQMIHRSFSYLSPKSMMDFIR